MLLYYYDWRLTGYYYAAPELMVLLLNSWSPGLIKSGGFEVVRCMVVIVWVSILTMTISFPKHPFVTRNVWSSVDMN